MSKILGELKERDLFNIVEFNSNVRIWDIQRKLTVDFPELGDSWYSGESNKSLNVSSCEVFENIHFNICGCFRFEGLDSHYFFIR